MKKTIAIFVSTLGSGGAEKQAALLAKTLSAHCNVLFVALYGDFAPSPYVLDILSQSDARVFRLRGSWMEKMRAYRKILKEHDVSCAFNYLTQCDFLGAIVERLSGVGRIYNGIRNSDMENYKTLLEFLSHNFVASGTVFNCYSGEDAFRSRGFRKKKCITIPNCFPDISEAMVREDKPVKSIVSIGRFVPQKDYETAIRTIAELRKKRHDFVFDIGGYGELEDQIRKWVEDYGVSDVVNIHIRPDNVPELLKNADVYLSTSLFEGTSNSIMEALNWSLPVVATNVGDNSRLVIDGKNGMLHPIRDAKGLAESLDDLLSDSDMRNYMGTYGNGNLKQNYSIAAFESKYLKLI